VQRAAVGKIYAIDLVSKKIIWERPAGTTRDMNIFGTHTNLPLPTGIFMMGEMSSPKVG
jgi:quinoprotein glucose dehydrogenase